MMWYNIPNLSVINQQQVQTNPEDGCVMQWLIGSLQGRSILQGQLIWFVLKTNTIFLSDLH